MLTAAFSYYLDCDGASRKKGCVHSRSKADLLGATADVEKQRRTSSSAAPRSVNMMAACQGRRFAGSRPHVPQRVLRRRHHRRKAEAKVGPLPGWRRAD
jgi:hypothetical protein